MLSYRHLLLVFDDVDKLVLNRFKVNLDCTQCGTNPFQTKHAESRKTKFSSNKNFASLCTVFALIAISRSRKMQQKMDILKIPLGYPQARQTFSIT